MNQSQTITGYRYFPIAAALVASAWSMALVPGFATAETVTTSSNCGGFPSGQTCFVVSDLVAGDTIGIEWMLPADAAGSGSPAVNLTATASITVQSIIAGQIVLNVSLANTTDPGTYTDRLSLTALGITTGDNTVTGGSVTNNTNGATWDFDTANFPAFSTDGCLFTGPTCAGGGGPSNSLNPGESDSFVATIFGDFAAGEAITLDTFATKWQTGTGSYEIAGVVPIPAAAWLFGSALLGIAGIGYRRTS